MRFAVLMVEFYYCQHSREVPKGNWLKVCTSKWGISALLVICQFKLYFRLVGKLVGRSEWAFILNIKYRVCVMCV